MVFTIKVFTTESSIIVEFKYLKTLIFDTKTSIIIVWNSLILHFIILKAQLVLKVIVKSLIFDTKSLFIVSLCILIYIYKNSNWLKVKF